MRMTTTGITVWFCVILLLCGAAYGEQRGTPDEAKALVKKAVAYYNAVGKERAFAEFNKPDGKFSNLKKGLYITVYDLNGKCHASGANKAMVGKDFFDLRDSDGKFIIRAGVDIAKSTGSGWNNYRWVNPASKKIEKKTTYQELVDDNMICSGAYLE